MQKNSFGPQFRFHNTKDYLELKKNPEVIKLRSCVLFRKQNHFGHYRIGVTIKAGASSVWRNKLKRQIRELSRTHAMSLGSFDYNVFINAGRSVNPSFLERLRLDFLRHLESKSVGR